MSRPLVALILLVPVAVGSYVLYERVAENRRIAEQNDRVRAEQERLDAALESPPEVLGDPFAGLDLSSRSGSVRTGGLALDRFEEQRRHSSDGRWIVAVEKSRQAWAKLSEADRLHEQGDLGWRRVAQEGRRLIQEAIEETGGLASELEERAPDAAGTKGVHATRREWIDKDRELRRFVGR